MTAIGETLRRERLKRNLELDQISRELKISARMLAAIEAEQWGKLPGGVFARSFVRQYARYLGLDEDAMATAAQRLIDPEGDAPAPPPSPLETPRDPKPGNSKTPGEAPMPRLKGWDSVADRGGFRWGAWLPALAGLVLVVFACAALYNWWQQHPNALSALKGEASTQPTPAPAFAPTPEPVPTPTPTPDASAQPFGAAGFGEATPTPSPTPSASPTPTPATPTPTPAPQYAADPNAPVRVQVTSQESVWVRARADGKFLFSVTLQPGQSRAVTGAENVELLLGNAGGAEVQLNGKPVGALGAKGQARTVQFTSGGFKIVLPPKPAAPAPVEPR